MPQVGQCPLDAIVAPTRVLSGQPHHEFYHLIIHRSTSWLLLASLAVVPLLGHQLAVPTQDGFWCEERPHLFKYLASEYLAFHG